jgi:hypothetical protein
MNFDSRGIPGISVVTTGFTDAVEVQSKALGFDPAILFSSSAVRFWIGCGT